MNVIYFLIIIHKYTSVCEIFLDILSNVYHVARHDTHLIIYLKIFHKHVDNTLT